MAISTVVFDFGNVVGFFSHRRSAEQVAAYSTMSAEAILAYLYGGRLEKDYEAGKLSTPVFLGMLRETCHLHGSDEQIATAYSDMFWPNPEVIALIPELRPKYKLFLLSNTNDLHYRQFREQFRDVLRYFDGLVLSHEAGVRKPDAGIYEACLRMVGKPASECVFIDDLPTNIEAARACGFNGLVYRQGDDLRGELARLGVGS